ncbi:hypothetical protein DSO57_1036359 [Entomophthora muscae]|uniref:Uncharacterized protein n=1 Tax=Entomophthora muscae TaxID=34485 RepID=A0ACC2UJM0_9FUNG|nr:hypothetical protein DSO57_1036359 [Entomophthora muscae]
MISCSVIPISVNLHASDLAIKALQHLKPNNIKLVLTQEHLVNFISNKKIAANPPPPKASEVLSELTLTHELKKLPSGECFLIHNNGPGFKDQIIFDGTFATCPWMLYKLWMIFPGATEVICTCSSFILFQELSLLSPNDDTMKTPPHMHTNPPDADKD